MRRWMQTVICLATVFLLVWPISAKDAAGETVTVTKTYNNAPFSYRMCLAAEHGQFQVYRVTYPSPVVTPVVQNNTIPADYYLPTGCLPSDCKYPAVICLHILDGNEELTELVCSVLARRGVPAISFKLPYYGERGTAKGPEVLVDDPKMFAEAVTQAGADIRRTIDVLASRPEINPQRIGITGISLGGIIAATAAGAEPRLYRAGLILCGGDLLQIIHHARETRPLSDMIRQLSPPQRAEVEAKIEAVDPLKYAAALRDRAQAGKVLMINASEDEVIPGECTRKLAAALGIADRVIWLKGLGHYTAMAELPRALRTTADFFAEDLPKESDSATKLGTEVPSPKASPFQLCAALVQQFVTMLIGEPEPGRCHIIDAELAMTSSLLGSGPPAATIRLIRGTGGRFSLDCRLPQIGRLALGDGRYPWALAGGKTLMIGTRGAIQGTAGSRQNAYTYVEPRHLMKLRMVAGIADTIALAPEILQRWITVENAAVHRAVTGSDLRLVDRALRITAKDQRALPGEILISLQQDDSAPAQISFSVAGFSGTVDIHEWRINAAARDELFEPPQGFRYEVAATDLYRIFSALLNFAAERPESGRTVGGQASDKISALARDPAGHGLLAGYRGKTILFVSGTPKQMGAAHGTLLAAAARKTCERAVYLVGGGDTLHGGQWFFDRMAEIERRTSPHIPPRFLDECDALAGAAGVSRRDARYANLFPERFHCSGVALGGKATAGGRVLHARVLDYMSEIDLQEAAAVTVFMPEGRHKWMSLGYAGFIGTVTAMNERGLAIGEMGGRGEGQWDGMPMSLLLREVMERAGTVEEALAILRAAPRTCEYYYVLSDRSGEMRALHCTPAEMIVLKPGQQHPRLPLVPEDTVLVSGEDRAKLLSQRIREQYGKIDVPGLIEIIKRPVAMTANLHDAIFAPESLEMWFADAGKHTPACDEPYVHVNLRELIRFYGAQKI